MCCFPGLFANALMRRRRKDGGIGRPKIAETATAPIFQRNPLPEATAGPFAVVVKHICIIIYFTPLPFYRVEKQKF